MPSTRPEALVQREERLEHEQVDAAVCERTRLLRVGRDREVVRQRAERLGQMSGRPERSRDQHVVADGFARELGGAAVHLDRAAVQRFVREAQRRSAEAST